MEPIPGPRSLPFLGNMLDVRSDEAPLRAIEHLADIYGPVYQLTIRGSRSIVVSSAEVMKELVDEKQFLKMPPPALANAPGPKGLFTARSDDPDWGQAHRILMPAFGPMKIEEMFDGEDHPKAGRPS
jgi:cytochrome P450 / NADPH-cytochrome P450 reductase